MLIFLMNSLLLGVGLAMDAFSVSLADGLADPDMGRPRQLGIAGTFAAFQFAMPMIGYLLLHTLLKIFTALELWIPWIALILLTFIGGKMLLEGRKGGETEVNGGHLTTPALFLQGIATSIDALSVGFTLADYNIWMAFLASAVIGAVTLLICMGGLLLGRYFGTKISGKAQIVGGIILIAIGVEIFLRGFFLKL